MAEESIGIVSPTPHRLIHPWALSLARAAYPVSGYPYFPRTTENLLKGNMWIEPIKIWDVLFSPFVRAVE